MDTIRIENLTKSFGNKKALDQISLNIKGSFGLLGPNGAGKTTLMRILTTLLDPKEGRITFGKLHWEDKNQVRRLIGYLPQHLSMYKNLKVHEILDHFSTLKGNTNKKERKEEVKKILKQVNLDQHQDKKTKHLSGGMLRRVGIAQALLGNPKILIVDEPTAGLDVEERARFRRLLRTISHNKIVIISSHIVEDLEFTCDHIGILKAGQVLCSGTRQEISHTAKGHIFEKEITGGQINEYLEDKLISTKQVGENYCVRFFSNKQSHPTLTPVTPTLEDAYLYMMRHKDENNGE